MNKYHIGIRLRGYAKDYLKALTCEISKNFCLETLLEKQIVPHITLLRPFTTENESKLVKSFGNVLSKYNKPIFYELNGFGVFENEEKVIYAKVNNNSDIEDLNFNLEWELTNKINFLESKPISPPNLNMRTFHCSVVSEGINQYFNEIKSFIENQPFPKTICPLFRVYLLRDKFILREYDFYLNKNLERFDAINPFVFQETVAEFKKKTHMDFSNGVLIQLPQKF